MQVHGLAASTADAAGESTLTSVLLLAAGAAFALVASLVVQAFVVPRVQARTRRLERWESDLQELWSLIDEQLVRAVKRYRSAAGVEREMAVLRDYPDVDEVLYTKQQRKLEGARQDARAAVEEHLDRASVMVARVRRLSPRAHYWNLLEQKFRAYQIHLSWYLWTAAGQTAKPVTDEEIDDTWNRQEDARKALADSLEPITMSMRPPDDDGKLRPWLRTLRNIRPMRRKPTASGS